MTTVTARTDLRQVLVTGPTSSRDARQLLDAYRAEVLAEAADAIDEVADAAEEDAIASDGYAYGRSNRTVAVHRQDAALLRRLAAAPTTERP